MRKVIKQAIPLQREIWLGLPPDAQFLSVHQDNGPLWLYILTEEKPFMHTRDITMIPDTVENTLERRMLVIFGTDEVIFDEWPLRHIGTIHPRGYQEAYHVFEVLRDR